MDWSISVLLKKVKVSYNGGMSDCKVFWEEAMKMLHSEYISNGKESNYVLWLSQVKFFSSSGNTITATVPSPFMKKNLAGREELLKVKEKLNLLTGQDFEISLIVAEPGRFEPEPAEEKPVQIKPVAVQPEPEIKPEPVVPYPSETHSPVSETEFIRHPQLDPNYTFDNYVVGEDNSFAYSASVAVAKNPGEAYNPLLIYGGVGLGKTHLMEAIGNSAWKEKQSRIIYISAENFTNEFIQSLNDRTMQKFKKKYRSVDILLIDDIHFLQNKDGTQEELFYIFEALYAAKKQMVFTCDRPASELKNLSDRLKSRFERGLNMNLQPPKYETRRAIIERKLSQQNRNIDSKVIDFIAQNVSSNVRQLEASLTKILAYMDLVGKTVTVDIAEQLIATEGFSAKPSDISPDFIIKTVAENYNVTSAAIKGPKRTKNLMLPRHIAMYIMRELTELSSTEIAAEFNGRDHSTALSAFKNIETKIKADSSFDAKIQLLIRSIKEHKINS